MTEGKETADADEVFSMLSGSMSRRITDATSTTDRQTDSHTYRHTYIQTDRHRTTETNRQTDRPIYKKHTQKHTQNNPNWTKTSSTYSGWQKKVFPKVFLPFLAIAQNLEVKFYMFITSL